MLKDTLFKFNPDEVVYEKVRKRDIVKHYAKIFSVGLTIGLASIFFLDTYELSKKIVYYKHHVLLDYSEIEKVRLREMVIEKIKEEEGFRAERYLCPSKKPTIGYGHVILKGEKFGKITEEKADRLLRKDFDYAYKVVNKRYPDIEYNKQLALAHFIFCFGETKFNKSSLPELLKGQKSELIKKKILEYDKAKVTDKDSNESYEQLSNLSKSREFEVMLWDTEILNIN